MGKREDEGERTRRMVSGKGAAAMKGEKGGGIGGGNCNRGEPSGGGDGEVGKGGRRVKGLYDGGGRGGDTERYRGRSLCMCTIRN